MCPTKVYFTLFCCVITTTVRISIADTIVQTTDFDSYIEIVDNLDTVAAKLRVLKSVWAEIITKYFDDVEKIEDIHRTIYTSFKRSILAAGSVPEQQEIDEFYQEVRQLLITTYGRYLTQILRIETQTLEESAQNLCFRIIFMFDYDSRIPFKIFENAIDQLYGLRSLKELAIFINSFDNMSEQASGLVIQTQLYLYWKFVGRNDIDDEYLLYIASYMNATKTHPLIDAMPNKMRQLDNAIMSLPTSLRNIFFTSNFFVVNANGEYLHQSAVGARNVKSQNIFALGTSNSVGIQFRNVLLKLSNTLMINLINTLYNQHIYRDENDNTIYAVSAPGTIPANSSWSLALNNNKIRFFQDNSYLCAAETFDANHQRYVRATEYFVPNIPSECEWYIDATSNARN